ncbi:MAG: 30S ribosomal protein S16 [Candidatus Bipolaricaulota bacterium]|nr:30S ribosomal protein S16 [Candidatus Bipolaricaulota bacterium]MCS7274280.1 30S ribosomal protein S16 [Candidatus Bipolaricaulota bacterium]MDW8111469.1 30S ribosomal protein S16 [Candidatus Bipolaricaulota bacterium]MDW8329388.1 30S ribosomal protein S16 [Candidatus Bipolaricaulota bacterium]
MAVKIRLKRMGKRGQPSYRVIVMDERSPRDGRVVAELGWYNPLRGEYEIDTASALGWLEKGAQPSEAARRLLSRRGVLAEFHKIQSQRSKT